MGELTSDSLLESRNRQRARAERFRSLAVDLAEALEDARAALSVGTSFQRVPRTTEVVVAALSKAKDAGLLSSDTEDR